MEYSKTIVSQANLANMNSRDIAAIQTQYKNNGSVALKMREDEYTIQKCPELFYKLLELTELKHELKDLIRNTPDPLIAVTTNRMMEIELIQTTKLAGIKIDKQRVRNAILNQSTKKIREVDLVAYHQQLLDNNFTVNNSIELRKLYYDYTNKYLTNGDLAGLGPMFRNKPLRKSVSKQYKTTRGVDSEIDIYNNMNSILDYLNNDSENIFIKIAIAHYLFEYNQPFSKYNGLMNRLITANYLYSEIDLAVFALSNTLVQNKTKYYTLVEETTNDLNINDLTAFVFNFICYIIDSIEYIKKFLTQNSKRIDTFSSKVEQLELTTNEKTCLVILYQAHLVKEPLTTKQLVAHSTLTNPTVLKCMTKLEQSGIATISKPGKQKVICLNSEWVSSL
ncbi:Fic family protein [Mollicutes bacterium LVI A0078]|nr:Fic family protein [Mollicutes bacterium LVI A0075]WOO90158.1 Fic family protein [Mollicutes bacterium LVI A0078]